MSAAEDVRRARRPAPSLAERTVETLRRLIVSNRLPPGAPLNEIQLAERLGVSRTPLREALKLLAAEGLVALRRNRAAIVAPLDRDELGHLFELERGLESFAAGLAATRLTAAELLRLSRMQDEMEAAEAAGERDRYIRINRQVHFAIVAGARNPALSETHERLITRLQRARNIALAQHGRAEASIREHRAILDALRRRDADTAAALMAAHVGRTGEIVAAICREIAGRRPAGRARAGETP